MIRRMDVVGTGLVSLDHLLIESEPSSRVLNGNPVVARLYQDILQKAGVPISSHDEQYKYLGSFGGGSVCNTMCYLSVLGFTGSIIGVVGTDEQGKVVRADLDDFGINHDHLIRKSDFPTRQYAHLIFPGKALDHVYSQKCPTCERRFKETARLKPEDLVEASYEPISRATVFHVDRPSRANVRLVDFAFEKGKIISFDFGYYAPFYNPEHVFNILKKSTIVKTSSHAASLFLKKNELRSFQDITPQAKLYINTLGPRGIEGCVFKESHLVTFSKPALHCPRFLESGGAGDAFYAGILYKVLKDGVGVLKDSLHETLDFAQALASLCCMFLGARGYLISKLGDSKSSELSTSIVSDVEDMIQGKVDDLISSTSGIVERRIPWVYNNDDFCLACGRARGTSPPNYYELSLRVAPTIMTETFGRLHGRESLDFAQGERVYVVGSGGSLSVAMFSSLLLNRYTGASAFAMTPYDFLEFGRPDARVILISYGGNNPDITSALDKAIDMKAQVNVITCNPASKLGRLVRGREQGNLHCITCAHRDTGFVSTIGMLSLIAGMTSLLNKHIRDRSLPIFFSESSLKNLFTSARVGAERKFEETIAKHPNASQRRIIALGSAWAWPAIIDFDSKMTEGGVCSVEISESKNYTHGRYINAYKNKSSRLFVLFSTARDAALTGFLERRFSRDFPVIVLNTDKDGPEASLELIVKQLFLANTFAKALGLDIARPRFPREARGLYSWGPIYRSQHNDERSNG